MIQLRFAIVCVVVAAVPRVTLGDWTPVESCIRDTIDRKNCPNAQIIVGRRGEILFRGSFGSLSVEPQRRPMVADAVFDLASLTKPIATATAVMILSERGKLNINDPVAKYIPAFAVNGKVAITIAQLLLHTAGFPPDTPLEDYAGGERRAIDRVLAFAPNRPPGKMFYYSDVGYIVLGELVRVIDGRRLDVFAAEEIFGPLGMVDAEFNPDRSSPRLVPTAPRDGQFIPGRVHDPRADALGGVAGHAGLFGSADDVAKFCRMLLAGGTGANGVRILRAETVAEMIKPRPVGDGIVRAYGFDVVSRFDSPRGQGFERGVSFGHTGFTGTSFWIDPKSGVWLVLLTSRLHPDGQGDVKQLRFDVATRVVEAVGSGR